MPWEGPHAWGQKSAGGAITMPKGMLPTFFFLSLYMTKRPALMTAQDKTALLEDVLGAATFPPGFLDVQIMLGGSDETLNSARNEYIKKYLANSTSPRLLDGYEEIEASLDSMLGKVDDPNLPLVLMTLYGPPDLNQVLMMMMMTAEGDMRNMLLEDVKISNLDQFYGALKDMDADESKWFLSLRRFRKHLVSTKSIIAVLLGSEDAVNIVENQPLFPTELRLHKILMELNTQGRSWQVTNRVYVEWCAINLPYDMIYDSAVNYAAIRKMLLPPDNHIVSPVLTALNVLGGPIREPTRYVKQTWSTYPEAVLLLIAYLTLKSRQEEGLDSMAPESIFSSKLMDHLNEKFESMASSMTDRVHQHRAGLEVNKEESKVYRDIHLCSAVMLMEETLKAAVGGDGQVDQVVQFLLEWPVHCTPRDVAMSIFSFLGDTYENMHRDVQCTGENKYRCGAILPGVQSMGELLRWGSCQLRRGDPLAFTPKLQHRSHSSAYAYNVTFWNVLLARFSIAMRAYAPPPMSLSANRTRLEAFSLQDLGEPMVERNTGVGMMTIHQIMTHVIGHCKGEAHHHLPTMDAQAGGIGTANSKPYFTRHVDLWGSVIQLMSASADTSLKYTAYVLAELALEDIALDVDTAMRNLLATASPGLQAGNPRAAEYIDTKIIKDKSISAKNTLQLYRALMENNTQGYGTCLKWMEYLQLEKLPTNAGYIKGEVVAHWGKHASVYGEDLRRYHEWLRFMGPDVFSDMDIMRMIGKPAVMVHIPWAPKSVGRQEKTMWADTAYFGESEDDSNMPMAIELAMELSTGKRRSHLPEAVVGKGPGIFGKFIELFNKSRPVEQSAEEERSHMFDVRDVMDKPYRFTPVDLGARAHPLMLG